MTNLSQLDPPIIGTRHGREMGSEADHFNKCPVFGQAVERRDLRQAIWHEQPSHKPLGMDA